MNAEDKKKYRKEYYEKNKKRELLRQQGYDVLNKEAISQKKKEYGLNNKERLKEYHKEFYQINREKILESQKAYNNTEERKKKSKEYNKEWREKNAERLKEENKKWYNDNKEACREYYYSHKEKYKETRKLNSKAAKFRNYGITEEQYNEMFTKQNGCCMICKTPQEEIKNALHIDHNHDTGKVRGLLCFNCNNAIGRFKNSIEILSNAIDYLKNND